MIVEAKKYLRRIGAAVATLSCLGLTTLSSTAVTAHAHKSFHPTGINPGLTNKNWIIYGDSIGTEIAAFLPNMVERRHGAQTTLRTYGGTNACKWFEEAEDDQFFDVSIVVIVFTGADFVSCMLNDGHKLPSITRIYRTVQDSKQLASMFPHAQIYFLSYPRSIAEQSDLDNGKMPLADIRNALFRAASHENQNWHFVDAAKSLYVKNRAVMAMPCKRFDDAFCDHGQIPVRGEDGKHMCPGIGEVVGLTTVCSTHSSGALRVTYRLLEVVESTYPRTG